MFESDFFNIFNRSGTIRWGSLATVLDSWLRQIGKLWKRTTRGNGHSD